LKRGGTNLRYKPVPINGLREDDYILPGKFRFEDVRWCYKKAPVTAEIFLEDPAVLTILRRIPETVQVDIPHLRREIFRRVLGAPLLPKVLGERKREEDFLGNSVGLPPDYACDHCFSAFSPGENLVEQEDEQKSSRKSRKRHKPDRPGPIEEPVSDEVSRYKPRDRNDENDCRRREGEGGIYFNKDPLAYPRACLIQRLEGYTLSRSDSANPPVRTVKASPASPDFNETPFPTRLLDQTFILHFSPPAFLRQIAAPLTRPLPYIIIAQKNLRKWKAIMSKPKEVHQFSEFIKAALPLPVKVVSSPDADGLASAAIASKFFSARGKPTELFLPARGENPYESPFLQRVISAEKGAILWLDLGSGPPKLPQGTPFLSVDDHEPSGREVHPVIRYDPKGTQLPTGLLLFRHIEEQDRLEGLSWLAEISAFTGEQEGISCPEEGPAKIKASLLREVTVLLNAAHRSSVDISREAAEFLVTASGPEDMLAPQNPLAVRLQRAREEVNAEWQKSSHIAPIFMWKVALVAFSSRCLVEGLVAAMWQRMLKKYIVLVCNFFLPKRVTFSAKTATAINLVRFLGAVARDLGDDFFLLGHPRAASGNAPLSVMKRLLARMHFREIESIIERARRGGATR